LCFNWSQALNVCNHPSVIWISTTVLEFWTRWTIKSKFWNDFFVCMYMYIICRASSTFDNLNVEKKTIACASVIAEISQLAKYTKRCHGFKSQADSKTRYLKFFKFCPTISSKRVTHFYSYGLKCFSMKINEDCWLMLCYLQSTYFLIIFLPFLSQKRHLGTR
jgi:hypothetical protein